MLFNMHSNSKNSTIVPLSAVPLRQPSIAANEAVGPMSAAPKGSYPRHLEERRRLANGGAVFLRPIRPADTPALRAGFKMLTLGDVRHRFFLPMKSLSPALAAQLCDIDYDRHMALVALDGARGTEGAGWGVARYVADPDRKGAELAIVVRSDSQHRGIGTLLLDRLLTLAQSRGIVDIRGDVLADNHAMLTLARKFGFRIDRSPEDAAVLRITKRLAA